ncbi:MAG TPA: MerR family DNA-binding transcriptional regulator, partial [Candidatus Saccharimonadales bacterium]|nr:MerR family DNA-binding transcriptional regulator [Candidatus Saccharimonadales bacterium]
MNKVLPTYFSSEKNLISIGEASRVLNISIDTLRRWEKKGKLKSYPGKGKGRHFLVDDINQLKDLHLMGVGEAAMHLGISTSTLRRLEQRGALLSQRSATGQRFYPKSLVDNFSQKSSSKVLRITKNPETFDTEKPIISKLQERHNKLSELEIVEANVTNKNVIDDEPNILNKQKQQFEASIFAGTLLLLAVLISSFSYVAYPQISDQFTFDKNNIIAYFSKNDQDSNVLGDSTPSTESWLTQIGNTVTQVIKPLQAVTSQIVATTSGVFHAQLEPTFTIDNKTLIPRYALNLPSSSFLKIPDSGLINNLNAQYLQGHQIGKNSGNVLILNEQGNLDFNGKVVSNSISSQSVIDHTLQERDLSPELLKSLKENPTIPDDSIENKTLKNASIKIKTEDGLTGGGTVDLGESITLSLVENCADNEIMKFTTVAGWSCAADLTGSVGQLDFSDFKDFMGLDSNTAINLQGNNLSFAGNGNVGIGTSSPSAKLDVVGNILVSGSTKFNNQVYTWPASQSVGGLLTTDG